MLIFMGLDYLWSNFKSSLNKEELLLVVKEFIADFGHGENK